MKHKFYQEKIVYKARTLRRKGKSVRAIAEELKVSRSTILRWCTDIHLEGPFRSFAFKLHEQEKRKGADIIKDLNVDKKTAQLLTSLLYWCEGGKYPAGNFISFCNSDVFLAKTFLQLFRLGFSPDENKIKASLQLHSHQDVNKVISFWSEALSIPKNQFYKSTITKATKNMKRKNYMGTCTIRYYDIYLLMKITGIYEGFSKKMVGAKIA